MTIENWFGRVKYYKQRINSNENTLKMLEDKKTALSAIDTTYEQVMGGARDYDRIGRLMCRIDELARMVRKDNTALVSAMDEILRLCSEINNPLYRMILSDIYIHAMTNSQIAAQLHYDERHIRRLRRKALRLARDMLIEKGLKID